MSETHELRLKIDAGAAESGARRFTGAINAVKKAVKDLDRDSAGAFKNLARIKPEIDVTPIKRATTETDKLAKATASTTAASDRAAAAIKRTALASASSLRTSEQAAQRLALRLGDIGNTAGIAELDAALVRLRGSLTNATDTLDVRAAKSQFDDLRSSLLQNTVAAEYLRGEQAQLARQTVEAATAAQTHAASLDALRAKYNPLYAESQKYERALEEIAQAEKAGALSANVAAQARDRAAAQLGAASGQMRAYGDSMRVAGHHSQNAAYQIQDVFVTAEMGMNPMRIALQQGTQLSVVMNDMARTSGGAKGALTGLVTGLTSMINPISLVTIGGIAAVAMLTQWATSALSAGEESKTFKDQIDDLSAAVTTYRQYADAAAQTTGEFAAKFGSFGREAGTASAALATIGRLDAIRQADAAVTSLTERFGGLSRTTLTYADAVLPQIDATFMNLRDTLAITDVQAATVIRSLEGLATADTMAAKVEAANALNAAFVQVFGSVEAIPAELLNVQREALLVALQVAEIGDAQTNVNSKISEAAALYARTRAESASATATANEMLASLRQQASMNALIAKHGRDSVQVTQARVAAERAAYAATVNTMDVAGSVKNELMGAWDAANGVASIDMTSPISSASQAAAVLAKNLGIALNVAMSLGNAQASYKESGGRGQDPRLFMEGGRLSGQQYSANMNYTPVADLITQLAPPVSHRGGGGGSRASGGGSGRAAALTEEQKAVDSLNDSLSDRLRSLESERLALEMLANGQYQTMDAAKLAAEAQLTHRDYSDQSTDAMLRQIDAAALLNDQLQKLAKDPVKEWMDSVPNWIEAGQQIEMGAIGHLRDAISNMIKTGKFDIESLGEAILGTIADIVADKAVAELANLMGRGDGEGLGGMLGGLFSSVGDAPIPGAGGDVASGGMQAGQSISTAMVQAGQQVSQNIASAMSQGGQQSGQAVQAAHAQGGQQAANATRMAGIQHGQQVRTATMTSGNQHANDVRNAITTAGQQHAQAVGMASMGSPGTGGGFLDSIGGAGGIFNMILGAFSEGGMSSSPVGSAIMPASAFRHAPHFSQGTANTSGIPAVLHDNEAVIPLSKGRKIPVEMNGSGAAGSGGNVQNFNWSIQTPDADSFRKSQDQISADMARAGQRSLTKNG